MGTFPGDRAASQARLTPIAPGGVPSGCVLIWAHPLSVRARKGYGVVAGLLRAAVRSQCAHSPLIYSFPHPAGVALRSPGMAGIHPFSPLQEGLRQPGLTFSLISVETYYMGDLVTLRAGDRVTLVCVGDGPNARTFAATVTGHSGSHVEVTLDEPFGNSVRPYILVSGEGDGANFVAIEEAAPSGAHVPLTTLGPWQSAADRRASARFPTYLPCQLIDGPNVAEGHLLDLSAHGVAVEAVGWAGGTFALRVDAGSAPVDIPCETVSLQNTIAGLVVVHARFKDLTVGEGMAVVALSELVRADFDAAQSRLVTPFRRPARSLATG